VLLAGGPNATFSTEETLDLLGVDACLRGAGEGTIARLVAALLGARAPLARLPALLSDIPNLVLRGEGAPIRTAPASLASFQREHFASLDDVPSPYQAGLLATPEAGLLTSRGCNQHCTYCSFAELSERRVAFHGVERVLDDLAAWRARLLRGGRRPAQVAILDDAFTLSPERARAICEGVVARGLELPFHCETRADRVDEPLLRLMRRAGFRAVSFGVESAVPRVLRAIGKVQAPGTRADPALERERAWLDTVRRAVRQARRAGLEVHLSVIGGLPGEAAADFRATLGLVRSLRPASYAHNLLAAMPGTPLHRDLAGAGMAAGRDPDTGAWVTRHAYDVRSVSPVPGSGLRRRHAEEALLLADALCGRPRPELEAPGGVWAVVLHGVAPEPRLAAWLGEVLTLGGAVVQVAGAPDGWPAWRAWSRMLLEARVAHGPLALLSPLRRPRGAFQVLGLHRPHTIELRRDWARAGGGVVVDATGRCRIRVWLGSDPEAIPPGEGREAPAHLAQIADGCRWWTAWPRCARPRVLHVQPDGRVTPCWHGPPIGRVGDPLPALLGGAAGRLRGEGRSACPIGPPPASDRERRALEWNEVASAVCGRVAAGDPTPAGGA
jgi:hypothetical protein